MSSDHDLQRVRRRLSRRLGRRARGKLVAVDRVTGDYLVANNLDDLLAAMTRTRRAAAAPDMLIFRLGQRAAVELRRCR